MHYREHSIGLCTKLCTDNCRFRRFLVLIGTLYEECACPRNDFGRNGEKLLLCSSGYRYEGVNPARSGGIDQGKPVFGTFKGERDDAKVMGNPLIGRVRNIFCL